MELSANLIIFLGEFRHLLIKRYFLLNILTSVVYDTIDQPLKFIEGRATTSFFPCEPGDIFSHSSGLVGVMDVDSENASVELISLGKPPKDRSLYHIKDTFTATPAMTKLIKSGSVETTVGRFILNYLILESCFGDYFDYINRQWNIKDIENKIAKAILDPDSPIGREEYDRYVNTLYHIGHFTELAVPTYSEKALLPNPEIKKRKKELLAEHTHELDDPLVMSKIEDELIRLDKEWLKDDPSMGFYGTSGKSFDVHRKKQFLTQGMMENLNSDKPYSFIENSFSEGWNPKDFVVQCDEIRRGSYGRSLETAKGGEIVKFTVRVLGGVKITEEDCGTKDGLPMTLTEENVKAYLDRTIIVGNKTEILTEQNFRNFIGKQVKIRSPMYCKTKDGRCYTCTGEHMRRMGMHAMGMSAMNIGSTFLTLSMKSMHGTKTESMVISDPEDFIVNH